MALREYRCTRNADYTNNCIGKDNLSARQGYYIYAHSAEEAWEQMASRYPKETEAGFTVEGWNGGGSTEIIEVNRDDN